MDHDLTLGEGSILGSTGDPTSYVSASPAWTPGAPFTTSGDVSVPDLLQIAGVA